MSGDQRLLLQNVGLGSVADVLDSFLGSVGELYDDIRGEKMSPPASGECAASREEELAGQEIKGRLVHDPTLLEAMTKRAPGANRLPELLNKVRELEVHSRGGPYESVLETMRSEIEAVQERMKNLGDAESQCALFGENFLLKPLVHYLSCWDVKQRKQLREQVDWAVRMRDQAYDTSMQLVSQGKIVPAREAEAKCLECGEKALLANKAQREALAKLERAACMDLRGYQTDAQTFLAKWDSAYGNRLDTIQNDLQKIAEAEAAAKDRREAANNDFENQLRIHADRLTANAQRRAKNVRDLRALLQDEIERERELKEEESALNVLHQDVEEWNKTVERAAVDMEGRNQALINAEGMLVGSQGVVNRMRKAEEELNATLGAQLSGRREALDKEKMRLAREHYDVAEYELKALTRKGDRLRRRGEILEQKRADCFFTIEMAYENEATPGEVRNAQQSAAQYVQESTSVRQQLEDLAGLAKTVDNDDMQNTMRIVGREHPQRSIREDLQRERKAYSEKMRQHLEQGMGALCENNVHYVNQSTREMDEIIDHKTSDQAANDSRHPAVFSPLTSRAQGHHQHSNGSVG